MLKFIDDNDFLLVDKYKQNDDGSVSWTYTAGNATHSGFLREGMTRVDGEDTVDIWAKFQSKIKSGDVTLISPTEEDMQREARELVLASRSAAYKAQSDPLFIEAVYDGTDEAMAVWKNKVLEIKLKYPLP